MKAAANRQGLARLALRVLPVAALCFAGNAGAANGSGYFNHTGADKPYEIKIVDAYAYRDKDFFDKTKEVTQVVLADKPIAAATVTNALDREHALHEQLEKANASYITITLEEGSDSPSLNVHANGSFGSTSLSGGYKLVLKVNDGKRVEGHITSSPDIRKDYPADLEFSLPLAVADAGTPLAAGGGEAGKAYLAYFDALRKGDVDAVARTMQKDRAEQMLAHRNDADFKTMFGFLQSMAPKEIHVVGGNLAGTTATLEVKGKDGSNHDVEGKVRMVRDGDAWRIGEEHLTTIMH